MPNTSAEVFDSSAYIALKQRSDSGVLFTEKWCTFAVKGGDLGPEFPHDDHSFAYNRIYFDGERRRCLISSEPLLPTAKCPYDWQSGPPAAPPDPAPRFIYIDAGARMGDSLQRFMASEAFFCHPSGWHVVAFEPLPPMHRFQQTLSELLNAGIPFREARARLRWDDATEACMREAGQG
jgi:hypothetical protein